MQMAWEKGGSEDRVPGSPWVTFTMTIVKGYWTLTEKKVNKSYNILIGADGLD